MTEIGVMMGNQPSFSLANAVGNLLPFNSWQLSGRVKPQILTDESGRTEVLTSSDQPAYLIANASAESFKSLSSGSGMPTGDSKHIELHMAVSGSTDVERTVTVLEFDADQKRISSHRVLPNQTAHVGLHSKTSFVVVAIRLKGIGSTTFEWLSANLRADKAPKPNAVDYSEALPAEGRPEAESLQNKLNQINSLVDSLSSEVGRKWGDEESAGADGSGTLPAKHAQFQGEVLEAMAAQLPVSDGSAHYAKVEGTVALCGDPHATQALAAGFTSPTILDLADAKDLATGTQDFVLFVHARALDDSQVELTDLLNQAMETGEAGHVVGVVLLDQVSLNNEDISLLKQTPHVFCGDEGFATEIGFHIGSDRVSVLPVFNDPQAANPLGSDRATLRRVHLSLTGSRTFEEATAEIPDVVKTLVADEAELVVTGEAASTASDHALDPVIIDNSGATVGQNALKLFDYNVLDFGKHPSFNERLVQQRQLSMGVKTLSGYAVDLFSHYPQARILAHRKGELISQVEKAYLFDEYMAQMTTTKALAAASVYEVAGMLKATLLDEDHQSRSARILVLAHGDFEAVSNLAKQQLGVEVEVIPAHEFNESRLGEGDFSYVVVMREGVQYDHYYLLERLNAFKFANVEFVTQDRRFVDGKEIGQQSNDYVGLAVDPALTMVPAKSEAGVAFLLDGSAPLTGHGYAVSVFGTGYEEFLRTTSLELFSEDKKLSVIVPVYNNGEFLLAKCIPSLLRNDTFVESKVLLIDDGSTDSTTIEICEALERSFPNIEFFTFADGGSGSASRPRNKGVEMADTEWITYLDPDNEISAHGYDNLLAIAATQRGKGNSTNFVSGYQVKQGEQKKMTGSHTNKSAMLLKDAKSEYFLKGKFPVVSTQASIITRDLLVDNNIEFIEGAAGQDSLYGWQVLLSATDPVFTSRTHLIYYSERAGSVTNQIDLDYFRKCLVRDKAQVDILEDLGVLDAYKEHHYDNFMNDWYVPKLKQLPTQDYTIGRMIVGEIATTYGKVPPLEA